MIKRIVAVVISLTTIVGILFFGEISEATAPKFSVQAVLPDSQRNQEVSYFDLRLAPNQQEILTVQVTNNSDEEMVLEIGAQTATTNSNGVINYGKNDDPADDTLPVDFSKIAKIEEESITLAGQESRDVIIEVNMPDKSFDGQLLGGITVSEKLSEEAENESQITNRFSYSLAVVISQTDTEVFPELDLRQVEVNQRNRRSYVIGSIQNQASLLLNDVNVEGKVYKKGETTPIYTDMRSDMRMAPNSTLPFGVSTGTKPLQSGEYTLTLLVTVDEDTWEFEEDFTITANQAKKFNEQAVNLEQDNTSLYLLIAAGVIGVLLIAILWLIKSKKREGQNSETLNKE